MILDEFPIKISPSLPYTNFCRMHLRGVVGLFDFMRYNWAYLCCERDLNRILTASQNYATWMERRLSIILARYDWKGLTHPNWSRDRLVSGSEIELINSQEDLILSGSMVLEFRFKKAKTTKIVTECEGTFEQVMHLMFRNKAFPATETDSLILERQAVTPKDVFKVSLFNFQDNSEKWSVPPKEAFEATQS